MPVFFCALALCLGRVDKIAEDEVEEVDRTDGGFARAVKTKCLLVKRRFSPAKITLWQDKMCFILLYAIKSNGYREMSKRLRL